MAPNVQLTQRLSAADETRTEQVNPRQLVTRDWLLQRAKTDTWNFFEHIVWFNVFWFVGLHVISAYAIYQLVTGQVMLMTFLFAILIYNLSLFGITAGVHRLWSHKSFKARLPFRIVLALFNSMAYQNSIKIWARDHRVHHKYSETNADPVSSARGFFFSHCGWLLTRKHPDVREFGGRVDLSDIMADPVVYYQHKYYVPSVVAMCFFLPTFLPWYLWSESLWVAFTVAVILRYTAALHATWLVNSAAHMYGYRPYDVKIHPVENEIVSALTLGEGFHNFHHTFPFSYEVSEWGYKINLTTFVLDQLAKIGQVYDRRSASKEMIAARKKRTGPEADYAAEELDY